MNKNAKVLFCYFSCIVSLEALRQREIDNEQGGAGMDVEVYISDNSLFFAPGPGGSREIRKQYRNYISTSCGTPNFSCRMAVASQKSERCHCPGPFSPIWGTSF